MTMFLDPGVQTQAAESANAKNIRYFAERDQRSIEEIVVKTTAEKELIMLVCKPDDWDASQKRTAILWIHGGGWTTGHPKAFNAHIRYTASRGAVSFGLQYRLMESTHYKDNKNLSDEENAKLKKQKVDAFLAGPSIDDLIEDCKDAVDHIRKNANEWGIDPSQLVSIGDSAGAHLAASLGTVVPDESKVNAVIACSSISDLSYKFGRDYVKPSPGFEDKEMEDDPDRWKRAKAVSPYYNISKATPPFLIINGEEDWLGDEPERFSKALRDANVPTTYLSYPKGKHAFIVYRYSATLEQITQTLLDVDAFLVKLGFLEGKSDLMMPHESSVSHFEHSKMEPFENVHSIMNESDFPPFLDISFEVQLPQKFNGNLVEMKDSYGFVYKISNKRHEFRGIRMRMRKSEGLYKPGEWNEVTISLGQDKVTLKINGHKVEAKNDLEHAFVSSEIIFGEIAGATFRNVVLKSRPARQ